MYFDHARLLLLSFAHFIYFEASVATMKKFYISLVGCLEWTQHLWREFLITNLPFFNSFFSFLVDLWIAYLGDRDTNF